MDSIQLESDEDTQDHEFIPFTTLLTENKLPPPLTHRQPGTFRPPTIKTKVIVPQAKPIETLYSKTVDSQNRMLSFLNHRVIDFQDASAHESIGDWLLDGTLPQCSFHLLQLKAVPSPPTALIDTPNPSLAMEYYAAAHQAGRTSATIKLALLLNNHKELWYCESKEVLMGYAAQENELLAIKMLASWNHEASLDSQPPNVESQAEPTIELEPPRASKRKLVKDAFKLWIQAALLNDIESTRSVSECYKNGVGVRVNNEKSLEYLERAAELGDSNAMAYVASIYRDKLTSNDALGTSRAAVVPELGDLCSEDEIEDECEGEIEESADRDSLLKKAHDMTLKAAKTSDVASLMSLGDMYTCDDTIWNDLSPLRCVSTGMGYYLQASEQGATGALLMVVKVLYEEWHGALDKKRIVSKVIESRRSEGETIVALSAGFDVSCENAGKLVKAISKIMEENEMPAIECEPLYEGVGQVFQLLAAIDDGLNQ